MAENQQVQKFKFFRVLLYGFSNQLAIPQRLTKFFIKEDLRSVTLLSPLLKSWNVRIGGDSKCLHFAEGWERFAAAHRLRFGELLLFKYVGGMVFHVTVFDKSTCQKDYKITDGVAGAGHVPGQGEKYEQECEWFKGKTTLTPASSGKRSFKRKTTLTPASSGQRSFKRKTTLTPASSGHRSTPSPVMEEPNDYQTQISVGKEKQPAVHEIKTTTKHKRGSRFKITITHKLKYKVTLPMKFTRSNNLFDVHQMLLTTPNSGGRMWPVNIYHYKQFVGHVVGYIQLTAGWRDFCIGNDLKDGDVCVFEPKKRNEMLVQISRPCGDGSRSKGPHLQQVSRSELLAVPRQKRVSPSIVTSCTSKPADPVDQFRVTLVPINLRKGGNMNIPRAFLSSVDLTAEKEAVLVDPISQRVWPVKISHCQSDGRIRMQGGGWEKFCNETDVEVGDECVFTFKFVGKEATFQVEVIKSKA